MPAAAPPPAAPAAPTPAPAPAPPAPAPAAVPARQPPTAGELADAIKAMLTDANMEEVSMKSVRQGLETKFGMSLSERKAEIKTVVTDFLESR